MAMISNRTKARVAWKAVSVPARVAYRMPHVHRRRARIDVPLPELHVTHGRRLSVPGGAAGMAAAAGGSALAAYLLDPGQGRRRRHVARDRGAKLLRRAGRRGVQEMKYGAGVARGKVHQVTPSRAHEELNDVGLARKVESEIFRPADAPKGKVDVNVERGVVVLRGQLASEEEIVRLIEAAARVEGVRGVESLLHRPGEAPPARAGAAARAR